MKIISGSSNPYLAQRISKSLGAELLATKIDHFNDGELRVQVFGEIGRDVAIIQSTNSPVNDHLMELLLLADTAKRSGAKNIVSVIPYFGYSRQDRCTYKNGPISARLVIKMLESSGITEVVTLDLHSSQLEGFFNIPVKNLSTQDVFSPLLQNQKDIVIVSPDIGGISRARNYSSLLGADLAIINKSRDVKNVAHMNGIFGDVLGKDCIIVDDIIDGANTICMATKLLIENGAKSVRAIVTHAVLSSDSTDKITHSPLQKIYISDSIYHKNLPPKFEIFAIDKLIGSVI